MLIASCASYHQVLAPSPEAGHRVATSSSSRGGLLWRLRDKQPRLGLFEIGPGHELHRLTCMMQAGLWAAIQVSIEHPLLVSGQSVPHTNGKIGLMGCLANTAELGIRDGYKGRNSGAWCREGGSFWSGG